MNKDKLHVYLSATILIFMGLCMGLDFGWGYIEPYVSSYLRQYNESITTSLVHLLYTIMLLSQIIGAQLFRPISIFFGYREGLAISMITFATGLFLMSISTSFIWMAIAQLFIGIALALLSLIGPFLMIGLMPESLGLAGGLGTAGPTIGPVFWSSMAGILLNYDNQSPTIEVQEGSQTIWYFGEEVSKRTPTLFSVSGMIILTLAIFGPPLLKNPAGMNSLIYGIFGRMYNRCFGDKTEPNKNWDDYISDNRSVLDMAIDARKCSFMERSVKIEESTRRSAIMMTEEPDEFGRRKSVSDVSARWLPIDFKNLGKTAQQNNGDQGAELLQS